ncbi:hypothetical protein KFE96_01445 [Kordiimonas sp. SCSIO 12603]|uniref:hypothetical protein n=1 Tax=Kordiimonas sp. SCSIO 12603 TaxID=2829596 RepID=UPI00210408E7|nr:hypothetical protein [Kordiimonas sp. SCSIO 12603]UTW59000.1 hypothetical protein KFE96_01445 [Kordiimonas sp. SCSIO 12603]
MEASEADNNITDTPIDGVQDNFEAGAEVSIERRLHLRSFDYWLSLKGERTYPLFSDLRAEDLAPFKSNSLLLEFNNRGVVVRFVGDVIQSLIAAPIKVGAYLEDFPDCGFSVAMIEQFAEEEGRRKAAEFEFLEEDTECRGMMLPFSSDGLQPNFIMVTASFRKKTAEEVIDQNPAFLAEDVLSEEIPQAVDTSAFDGMIIEYAEQAGSISHKDQQNRIGLYEVLAQAYRLYEQSVADSDVFAAVLAEAGLKQQARAPYTPALKLVFGKGYDKTRITEYAAAISCASRSGISSTGFVEYLLGVPGGIKGCVQEEREYKRQKSGTPAHNRQQEAIEVLRQKKAKPLKDINPDDEFCLVLARRKSGGGVEALGCANTGKAALDSAIRQLASSDKK